MARTIYYDIFGDLEVGPIRPEQRDRILEAQAQMNKQFSWTHDNLKLNLFSACYLSYPVPPPVPWAARLGGGASAIGGDDWNAALILRFLDWVSTDLPERAFVRVCDEGGYLIAGNVILRDGHSSFDEHGFQQRWGRLREDNPDQYALLRFGAQRAELRKRRVLNVPAETYGDAHPEIERILSDVRRDDLDLFTLEVVADAFVMPWKKQTQGAA